MGSERGRRGRKGRKEGRRSSHCERKSGHPGQSLQIYDIPTRGRKSSKRGGGGEEEEEEGREGALLTKATDV